MMTSTSFTTAAASAPGGVDLGSESSPSTSEPVREDFFNFISQARANRSDKFTATVDHSSGGPGNNTKCESPQVPQSSSTESGSTPVNTDGDTDSTTSEPTSKAKNQPVANDAASKTGEVDLSLTSTIMAMMLPPGIPPTAIPVATTSTLGVSKILGNDNASGAIAANITSQPQSSSNQSPTALADKKVGISSLVQCIAEKQVPESKTTQNPVDAKTNPETCNSPPADISTLLKGLHPDGGTPEVTPPQQVVADISANLLKGVPNPVFPDGTSVALSRQRMKLSAEKNEIAGGTVQKLQGAPNGDGFSTEADSSAPVLGLDSNISGRKKDVFNSSLDFNFTGKSSLTTTEQPAALEIPKLVDQPGAQADRVAQLVSREVVSLRQSGADSIAVSLKVDAHTEISLQLTTRDGQIEASVRCERGSLAGLDGHWTDLQASLAKQNIHLVAPDEKSSTRASSFNLSSNTGGSSNFSQSSQQSPRQIREATPELAATAAVKPARNPQPKNQNVSRQGWESWA